MRTRFFILIILILISNFYQSQDVRNDLKFDVRFEEDALLSTVKIENLNQSKVSLKNGTYHITNDVQDGEISIKDGKITGTFTAKKSFENTKENKTSQSVIQYTIKDSWITNYTKHIDNILSVEAKRENLRVSLRSYYPNQKLAAESWISIDKKKNYGTGLTKKYYEDGTPQSLRNTILETYTDYYPNGNVEQIKGPNLLETYNKDGSPDNKQFFKNKIQYNDYYYDGKLSSRSYKNAENHEVKENYEKGVFKNKEVTKIVNGSRQTVIFDKNNQPTNKSNAVSAAKNIAIPSK